MSRAGKINPKMVPKILIAVTIFYLHIFGIKYLEVIFWPKSKAVILPLQTAAVWLGVYASGAVLTDLLLY